MPLHYPGALLRGLAARRGAIDDQEPY